MGSDLRRRMWKRIFRESASRFTRLRSQLHHAWSFRLAGMSEMRTKRRFSTASRSWFRLAGKTGCDVVRLPLQSAKAESRIPACRDRIFERRQRRSKLGLKTIQAMRVVGNDYSDWKPASKSRKKFSAGWSPLRGCQWLLSPELRREVSVDRAVLIRSVLACQDAPDLGCKARVLRVRFKDQECAGSPLVTKSVVMSRGEVARQKSNWDPSQRELWSSSWHKTNCDVRCSGLPGYCAIQYGHEDRQLSRGENCESESLA